MRQSLVKDIRQTVGSIYRMNAPHAIGYLFNATEGEHEIADGMYCDRLYEIDPNRWDYFLAFDKIHREEMVEKGFYRILFRAEKGHIYRLKSHEEKTILEETNTNLMEVPA
jgi:hypothetical protein